MNGYSLRIGPVNFEDTRTRQYVGVGVTVVWIIILVIGGLVPAIQSALQAQSLIVSERSTEASLIANVSKIKQAQALIIKARESETIVTAAVPFTKKSITAINEIDLMTAKHGLAIDNLAISGSGDAGAKRGEVKVEVTEGLVSIGFTLGVNGSYGGIRDLIHELEGVPRLIKLSGVDIGSNTAKSKSSSSSVSSETEVPVGEISATILGSFYYNPQGDVEAVSVTETGN